CLEAGSRRQLERPTPIRSGLPADDLLHRWQDLTSRHLYQDQNQQRRQLELPKIRDIFLVSRRIRLPKWDNNRSCASLLLQVVWRKAGITRTHLQFEPGLLTVSRGGSHRKLAIR